MIFLYILLGLIIYFAGFATCSILSYNSTVEYHHLLMEYEKELKQREEKLKEKENKASQL